MRHAKAEAHGPTDFERELAQRGRDDAAAAGRWLAEQRFAPEVALVSAATRTRQTWECLSHGAGWEVAATYDRGLYAADPETALDVVRVLADDVRSVSVLGHNPTMSYLAAMLDDGEGDASVGSELAVGFPTSALALFTYAGEWASLGAAAATLKAHHVGRG